MKKTIKTILCTLALAVLAVSCQKEINEAEPVANVKKTIDISINGLMGEYTQVDATRSELVNTIRVSWNAGDVVYVYDGNSCLGSLVASLDENEDNRYALLSTGNGHTVTAPEAGTKLTLVHSPLLTEAPAVSNGAISISLAGQSGTKAPFVTYATLDYVNEASIANAIVPFKFATSVIRVNCTGLKAGTAITSASLSNVETACKLTLSGTAAPIVDSDVNGIIVRTGDAYFAAGKVNAEGEAVFQIAVPKLLTTSEERILTVTQGTDSYKDYDFTKNGLSAATSVNTVCQFGKIPAGALSGKFSVSNDNGANITQVYFSQGNLWYGKVGTAKVSTFNFETNQYDVPENDEWNSNHVSHFYWSKSAEEAVKEKYDKSQDRNIDDVFFTNTTETTAQSDFTVNGVTGKFRALSTAEWQYLLNYRIVNGGSGLDKSYSLDITYGGKMGLVLYPDDYCGNPISGEVPYLPNGAVFLPAAGIRHNNIGSVGEFGTYWSSSAYDTPAGDAPAYDLPTDEPYNYAFPVAFSDEKVISDAHDSRWSGACVRLVTDCK
ncbi:MAG: hypothetical protein KBT00_01350 [Bacteroidales bacterium]|nr:hypothetical protein [Candidatus Cacconaster merdequi]